jgi:hypothetical protein
MPHRGRDVVTGLDYLENVMSTKHLWVNLTGIGLVILGLVGLPLSITSISGYKK